MDVSPLAGEVPGLEGISRAEGASGFLQSQRSLFDVSGKNLNDRLWCGFNRSQHLSAT